VWQPISTHQKDDAEFIGAIWWDDEKRWEVLPLRWYDWAKRYGRDYAPFIEDQEQPLKWQPMPAPPTDQPTP